MAWAYVTTSNKERYARMHKSPACATKDSEYYKPYPVKRIKEHSHPDKGPCNKCNRR